MPERFTLAAHWVDHIVAEKHGGLTEEGNLALSCVLCNQHKGTDLASLDPEDGRLTPLFHPRRDRWADHFRLDAAQDRATDADRPRDRPALADEPPRPGGRAPRGARGGAVDARLRCTRRRRSGMKDTRPTGNWPHFPPPAPSPGRVYWPHAALPPRPAAGRHARRPFATDPAARAARTARARPPTPASSSSSGAPSASSRRSTPSPTPPTASAASSAPAAPASRASSSANTSRCWPPATTGTPSSAPAPDLDAPPVGGLRGAHRLPAQPRHRRPHRQPRRPPQRRQRRVALRPRPLGHAALRAAAAAGQRRRQPHAGAVRRLLRPAARPTRRRRRPRPDFAVPNSPASRRQRRPARRARGAAALIESQARALERSAEARAMSVYQARAVGLLAHRRCRQAFDLGREPARRARALRPQHARPVVPAGPPARRGGREAGHRLLGLRRQDAAGRLGHAQGQLPPAARTSCCRRWTAACRP